jgi:hypothetical protein
VKSEQKGNDDSSDPKMDNIGNYDVVEAFVTFQKDKILNSKFRFELGYRVDIVEFLDQKRIRAPLYTIFVEGFSF